MPGGWSPPPAHPNDDDAVRLQRGGIGGGRGHVHGPEVRRCRLEEPAREKGKIHRVDPDFGSPLTVANMGFSVKLLGQLENYGSTL